MPPTTAFGLPVIRARHTMPVKPEWSMLLHITLCAIAATTKSPRYYAFLAVFFLLYNLAMLGTNLLR